MPTQIFLHPLPAETLLPILASHLPQAIPLYRRLQFHIHSPAATARVFATFPPSNPPTDPLQPWLAAQVDLNRGIETQAWIFSSLELDGRSSFEHRQDFSPNDVGPDDEVARRQWVDFLLELRKGMFPQGASSAPLLIGALHTRLRSLTPEEAVDFTSEIYAKYIFTPSSFAAATSTAHALPNGYTFAGAGIPKKDLQLVVSRTHIPRTVQTLATLPSVAVYDNTASTRRGAGGVEEDKGREPVSWAFLGLDASLTSLHVEPEHRGKKLGVDVAKAMFRDGLAGEIFGRNAPGVEGKEKVGNEEEGNGIAHSDVALDNWGSRKVMDRLGGVPRWSVVWTRVDLSKLGE